MTSNLLKNSLRANAVFSILCAIDLLFFNQFIAKMMGDVDARYLFSLGIALLGFAITLLLVSERAVINLQMAKAISGLDISWVIGSILLMILGREWFTVMGQFLIASVALIVALCAHYQIEGIRQLRNRMLASNETA